MTVSADPSAAPTSSPPPRRPAPLLTDDNAVFWEGAVEGRLSAQRCSGCAQLRHPPRPMCPHCHSLDVEVVELSGRGTLYSYAILHHPQHPAFEYPIIAAIVDLEEGLRLVSNLTEIEPGEVAIGLPVEVTFEATENGGVVPVFRPERTNGTGGPS